MKILIIITTPDYPLWEKKTQNWATDSRIADFDLRTKEIQGDKVLLFRQFKSQKRPENKNVEEVRSETAERLLKVINCYAKAQTLIAAHKNMVDWSKVGREVDKAGISHRDFVHKDEDDLYQEILNLAATPVQKFVRTVEREIKKKIDSATAITHLKHRISHLFLPLQVDLQGLSATRSDEKGKYAADIIAEYGKEENNSPFQCKLADLQFLVAKSESSINDVAKYPSLDKNVLPEDPSSGERLSVKQIVEQAASRGAHASDELKELRSKCAFDEDWQPDPRSDIARFLEALDEAVQNNCEDEFLPTVNDGAGDGSFNGEDYCKWFDGLESLLGKIRTKLREAESKK